MADASLLDELESVHREVDRLLEDIADVEVVQRQQALVDRIVAVVAECMFVEENDVFPDLAVVDPALVERMAGEHDVIRHHLDVLITLTGRRAFQVEVAALRGAITRHVESEVSEAFDKLRHHWPLAAGS